MDRAEDEKLAFEINEIAVRNIAKISKELDCCLIHYSTDYVFDGNKNHPTQKTIIQTQLMFTVVQN